MVLKKPNESVRQRLRLRALEAAPAALETLIEIAAHSKDTRARILAAREVFTLAGAYAGPGQGDKDLSDMTSGELRAIVERAQARLLERAKPVLEHEAHTELPQITANPLDLFAS